MGLKRKVVIVGGCIAAKEAANAIRKTDLSYDVTIISSEDYLPYYRPMLSRAIGQDLAKSRLYLAPESWYKEHDVEIVLSTEITKVLPDENKVIASNGDVYDYNDLIIATGARNFIPMPNATDMGGVLSIRDYDDVMELRSLLPKAKNAVVIGSGLLGLEAAWELKERNINVTILERNSHALSNQLDEEAADFLTEHMAEKGVTLACNRSIEEIKGDEHVTSITCTSGEEYPCDLLLFSTGIIPNTDLVKDTDIETDRGIIVDEHMRTNIPNIYAAGDVAQNEYKNSGIWVPAMEMGKVAGSNLVGKTTSYKPLFTSTMLTAFGVKIFSIGNISNETDTTTESIVDPRKRFFKKIFAKDGILVGAILIGDISQGTRLAKHLGKITLEEAKELIE